LKSLRKIPFFILVMMESVVCPYRNSRSWYILPLTKISRPSPFGLFFILRSIPRNGKKEN